MPIELLVLQATSFCNLDCRYCYVPERSNRARMSGSTLHRVGELLASSALLGSRAGLEVLWHAGEPLAAGLDFYRQAGSILSGHLPNCTLEPSFQTNATLITEGWCDYFAESHAKVGISIDGPEDIHDSQRMRRHGKGSFQETMRGAQLLRSNGMALSALCVLTPASLREPKRMFDFFDSTEFSSVAFNVEEAEGEHLISLMNDHAPSIRSGYSAFMKAFLEENERRNWPLTVREFQLISERLRRRARDTSYYPVEPENELGRVLTISRDGEIFSWSPELASGYRGDALAFSLGNVHSTESLDELLTNRIAVSIQSEIDRGVVACRKTCEYFSVCGGGLPSNKIYENGSFDSTATSRCRLQIKMLTDILLDHCTYSANDAEYVINPSH